MAYCGDTMIAGLAIDLEQKMEMKEILRMVSSMATAGALRTETGYF